MSEDDRELSPKYVNIISKTSSVLNVSKFSKYLTLVRVVAWMKRFMNNKFRLSDNQSGDISAGELQEAKRVLCLIVQSEVYNKEFIDLKSKQRVDKSSTIYKLSPIIGDDGLIRLNGRIGRSDVIPAFTKRPVILPKDHPLTRLIVHHHHCLMKHQNTNAIMSEIRQRFWIPNMRTLIKKAKLDCQDCKNRSAKPNPPMMSELPFDRVTAYIRPFTYCGVDYFGPYDVSIGRRREKRWVALFTCLTVRAVHLELATACQLMPF